MFCILNRTLETLPQTANFKHILSDKIQIMDRKMLKLDNLFNKSKIYTILRSICMITETLLPMDYS